jgi:hypothetical protein
MLKQIDQTGQRLFVSPALTRQGAGNNQIDREEGKSITINMATCSYESGV